MKILFVIVGPTAIGKTALAIEVAKRLGTEIVSCDSRQFYKEMNIGVARPSDEELSAVKHHFIAHRSVVDSYNAFDFEQDALAKLEDLFGDKECAVAVGGSGLYVDALCQGIALLPDPRPGLREELQLQLKQEGIESFQRQLEALDPEYYAEVDRQNPVRLQRALEVILTSGQPYSQIIKQTQRPRPFKVVKIGLRAEREIIKDRINRRVDVMEDMGLVEEVAGLMAFRDLIALKTVGYKEIFSYLDGDISLERSLADIKIHTWQYAKKQLTWLNRYEDIFWINIEKKLQVLQVLSNYGY
ncbi:MAG: tRNA (adenosine(37)-N6)-dimethylallyltransferase MiaA [Bacteroidales bacterium]|nr:tRNA (adenosine(37)-N6)-dimethylallyltransferase MiaA [Bacteroidales bacterium]